MKKGIIKFMMCTNYPNRHGNRSTDAQRASMACQLQEFGHF